MLIVSEKKLDDTQIADYRKKNYRIVYSNWSTGEEPKVKLGEQVGFILDTFQPRTIKFIEKLIYRQTRSLITAKYDDKKVRIDKENWKSTHYDDKTRRWYSIKNPVLEIYDEQQKIRRANRDDWKKRKQTEELEAQIGEIPEDLEYFISTFGKLYEVDYDPEDTLSKLRAYQQCKYYLDNDFEYSRDALGQLPTEEKMFECISFGDENYMQDTCFKRTRKNRKYYA